MWKWAVSIAGIALFALAFVPFFRKLSARQVAWLAFAALVALTPWLPIEQFQVGDTSVKLFQEDSVKASSAALKELRELAAASKARSDKQQAQIDALVQVTAASKVENDRKISALTSRAIEAERQYRKASTQAAVAQDRLEKRSGILTEGSSSTTSGTLRPLEKIPGMFGWPKPPPGASTTPTGVR